MFLLAYESERTFLAKTSDVGVTALVFVPSFSRHFDPLVVWGDPPARKRRLL
jgi:hypothetical protein